MHRKNNLTIQVLDPDNLRLAFWKASKGKRHAQMVLEYQKNLDVNLLALREQIRSGDVQVGAYRFFKIFEPKERQICASAFSEQVLHHALMNVCHPYFEKAQIFDSYASRKGKGTYAALARAKTFAHAHDWYLKLDVRKFFGSICHRVLKAQLDRMFKDRRLLDIFGKIIDSYESSPERGLPIGNLTSQYFANHYLAGLDHFILERLRIRHYVRYMDDMVLWHDDKRKLLTARDRIREFVEDQLRCELKPETFNSTREGVSFLGYRIFPDYVHLTQQSKHRFIRKIRKLQHNFNDGTWSQSSCQRHILPLLAYIRHAETYAFRENVFLQMKGPSP